MKSSGTTTLLMILLAYLLTTFLLMFLPAMSDPEAAILLTKIIDISFIVSIGFFIAFEAFILCLMGIYYAEMIKSKGKKFGLFMLNAHLGVAFLGLAAYLWPNIGFWLETTFSLGALVLCNTPLVLYINYKRDKEAEKAFNKACQSLRPVGRGIKIY